jgi:nitrate reductase (cytochrome), electron transfer subunit
MRFRTTRDGGLPLRIVLVGAALISLAAVILGVQSRAAGRAAPDAAEGSNARVATRGTAATEAMLAGLFERLSPSRQPEPIAAEAHVFRPQAASFDAGSPIRRRSGAHARTLATFRAVRAYPGAPPRIPHGLTADEYRVGACAPCHQRGGYSTRFAAYAPVTPHPELTQCLQCHLGDALLMDVPGRPAGGPDGVCRQCHAPAVPAATASRTALDWRPAAWPAVADATDAGTTRTPAGSPPPITHDLQLRGDCRACHTGPAAVEEIRTTHPERTNCRQCHVTVAPMAGEYTRAVADVARDPGGER